MYKEHKRTFMAEMKNSLETTKLKKSFRKQVKMTEIENHAFKQ